MATVRPTPSSVKALDFGGNGRGRGRRVWPSEGNGSSLVANTVSSLPAQSQDWSRSPTWADRVRGGVPRAGCSPSASLRPSPSGNGGSRKTQLSSAKNVQLEANESGESHNQDKPVNGTTVDIQREKSPNSEEVQPDSNDTAGVDQVRIDHQSGKEMQEKVNNVEEDEEEEDGGGWERVSNSRSQSRNNSVAPAQQSTAKLLGTAENVSGDDVPSSDTSPSHEITYDSSPPTAQSQEVMSQPDDFMSAGSDAAVTELLSIEDLTGGGAAMLLLDGGEEREKEEGDKEEEEEGLKKKLEECGTINIGAGGQSLSQASDKVHVQWVESILRFNNVSYYSALVCCYTLCMQDAGWSDIVAEYEGTICVYMYIHVYMCI